MDLVHPFAAGVPVRIPSDRAEEQLGGKGLGLAIMAAAGLPVPPGFTLTTEVGRRILTEGWTGELAATVHAGIAALEASSGRRLGDPDAPLLVSVRSGAAVSMPGMMDTVLNVGMTSRVEEGLAQMTGDEVFAADSHRRFRTSFASVVGDDIPDDPFDQIVAAVEAVVRSWTSPRARAYRAREGIDDELGTAATVQQMVFGNLGDDSGTGVAFTRDPSTGTPGLVGDFLVRAQGEDVVAGTHTTLPLDEMRSRWPDVHAELGAIAAVLERTCADMVDIEFTVERGTLWLLQARPAKRSPTAEFRVAVDMADDPSLPVDRAMAVERCRHLLAEPPRVTAQAGPAVGEDVVVHGLAASPGRAAGVLCTDIDDAIDRADRDEPVILARRETSPADVHGIAAAVGLITSVGGLVSHAAVVARAWGLPAVVGASAVDIDPAGIHIGGRTVAVGETVTVDGTNGVVIIGRHLADGDVHPAVATIRSWADELDPGTSARSSTPT